VPCAPARGARDPTRPGYGSVVKIVRGLEIACERAGEGPPLVFVSGAAEDDDRRTGPISWSEQCQREVAARFSDTEDKRA
jgi:hypothetical protein